MPLDESHIREERIKQVRALLKSAQGHLYTLHHAVPTYVRGGKTIGARMAERFPDMTSWRSMVPPALERDSDIRIGVMADEQKHGTYSKIYRWFGQADSAAERHLSDERYQRFMALEPATPLNTSDHDGPPMEDRFVGLEAAFSNRIALFIEQLRDDGEHEDVPVVTRDAAGGWPHLRGLVDDAVIDGYLKRMRSRRTKSEISNAIGAAKELTEATMKALGEKHGIQPAKSQPDLQDWWKALRPHLADASIEKALGSKEGAIAKLVSGQVSTISALGELRNSVGTGHGRWKHPAGLEPAHALLAIDSAHAITRYLAH